MKKSKILSLVTALALSISMLPSAASAANDNVIWEEGFNGGLSGYDVTNCEITDGVLKNATATGSRNDGGFNFATLDAKAEGKIRFKYDVKTDNGNDVSKSEIKTNGANIPLLYYWYGGIREVTDPNGGTGAEFGYEWYTNDIVMDFDAGKITVNITKTETGEVVLSNYVINNDFAGITTIKGVDIWGWDSDRSQEKYYDNFLMEYVDPYLIYAEDYNEDVKFQHTAGTAPTVVNGVVQTAASGESGFSFDTLNAAVADAPSGKVRVRFDFNSPDTGAAATKMTLKTNSGNITFLSYGVWGALRDDALSDATGNPGFAPNVWHDNDIVFDFENNKIIYTVTNKKTGAKVLDGLELSKDLSGVTHVKGFDLFGWAGVTYFDNLLIEYVKEEAVPADKNLIYSENYDRNINFQYTAGTAPTVENGAVKRASGESGFSFDFLKASIADAPSGKIRVKFDFNSPDPGPAATKMTLVTDAKNITYLSYGLYGAVRDDVTSDATGNPGFAPNVWHENDVVFDFANNKVIYTVTNKETGAKLLDGFELSKDLSGVTYVKGFDLFGWSGTTYFDNLLIEYVEEEVVPEEPVEEIVIEEVNMGEYAGKAWDVTLNAFDSAKTYTANFADGEEVKSGEIGFENVETEGSVAFAIFLHTSRANVALDIVAE